MKNKIIAQSSSRKSVKVEDEDIISADTGAGDAVIIVDSPQSSPVHSPQQMNYAEHLKSRGFDIAGFNFI